MPNSSRYTEEIRGLVDHVSGHVAADAELPLFRQREVGTTGVFLITSDRGLCGSYNTNVLSHLREAEERLRAADPGHKVKFFCYGRKGYSYLSRRGRDIERFFVEPPLDKADFSAARMVSDVPVTPQAWIISSASGGRSPGKDSRRTPGRGMADGFHNARGVSREVSSSLEGAAAASLRSSSSSSLRIAARGSRSAIWSPAVSASSSRSWAASKR